MAGGSSTKICLWFTAPCPGGHRTQVPNSSADRQCTWMKADAMRPLRRLISAHWRGAIGLGPAVIGVLIGGHVAMSALRGFFQAPTLIVALSLAAISAVAFLWQAVGSFRAADAYIADRGDMLPAFATYGAIIVVAVLGLVQSAAMFLPQRPETVTAPESYKLLLEEGVVLLRGNLDFRDFEAVQAAVAAGAPIHTINLDSPGGRIHAARGLARLVLENQWRTEVTGNCFSACPLIFVAGTERHLGPNGRLGFHRYAAAMSTDSATQGQIILGDVAAEIRRDREFYASRGIDADFLDQMFTADHAEIWRPNRATLVAAGFVTE